MPHHSKLRIAFVLLGLVLHNHPVRAQQEPSLLEILRDKGTITQEEYETLKRQSQRNEEHKPKPDADVNVEAHGGIAVSTNDERFDFEFGGRLHIDTAFYDQEETTLGDGTELRRARLGSEGILFYDWTYEFDVDFAEGDAAIKDAYIGYIGFPPALFFFGQVKEPFSLEDQTSSNYITFMERALLNELTPGRNIGFLARTNGTRWTTAAGLFGEEFDDDPEEEGDEGWGLTGRFTYAPLFSDERLIHLGAAASRRSTNDQQTVDFSAQPESQVTDVEFVDTGDIEAAESITRYAMEAAGVWGPFSAQGEYLLAEVDREGLDDLSFDGWYAYASWFPTGESRPYELEEGEFKGVDPLSPLGAWELGLRYSVLDLNDEPIRGGRQENLTLGLNWYINSQMRIMANYIQVNNDPGADAEGSAIGDDDPSVFQMRFQVTF